MTYFDLKSVLITNPLLIESDRLLIEAIALMSQVKNQDQSDSIKADYVLVTQDQRAIGIITQGDIIDLLAQNQSFNHLTVQEVMKSPLITIDEDDLTNYSQALKLLKKHKISYFPVINHKGQIIGLLTKEILQKIKVLILENTLKNALTNILNRKAENKQLLQDLSAFKRGLDEAAIVSITDAKGVITYVNERFCQISGYGKSELMGKTHHLINSGYHSTTFFQCLWQTIQQGKIWRGEICNRSKNGNLYWVETTIVPFLDHYDQPFQYLSIRFDITSCKLVQTAMDQENLFRRKIMDKMGEGLSLCHSIPEYPYLYFTVWNQQMERITGYTIEEINRLGWYQTLFPDPQDQTKAISQMTNLDQGDHLNYQEWEIKRQDGHKRIISLSTTILASENEHHYFLNLMRDITEIKQAEKALKASENWYRQMFNTSVVGMLIADFQGNIIEANDCFLKMVGYTREELELGLIHWNEMTPPEFQAQDQASVEHFKQYGYVKPWQKEYYRKDGTRVPILIGAALLPESDHETICVIVDISDRKEYENKLQQTNLELQRATRLKDEFLANMSHELRTPLNAILGLSEALQDEIFGRLNQQQLKAVQTITQSGNHLLTLINDILDLAKIEAGKIKLNLTTTSVNNLCEFSLVFIQQQALEKNIKIETVIPENLPDLLIDELRIRQVLINLLNNAVKFTPKGGKICLKVDFTQIHNSDNLPHAEVIIEKPQPAKFTHQILFTVSDNGIGISEENLTNLFKPFMQIDSALNRQYSGTGLGLALVKKLVELHHGEVKVTSKVGEGSSFTFSLPCDNLLLQTSKKLRKKPLKTEPNQINDQINQSPVILLAEDNFANIMTVSSYLKAKGYQIILAKNGQEAVDLVETQTPDLILMDISMPEMNGFCAIEKIRQNSNQQVATIPIVALTALAMTGDRQKCLEAGANDYLAKPIKLNQLTNIIQEILVKRN